MSTAGQTSADGDSATTRHRDLDPPEEPADPESIGRRAGRRPVRRQSRGAQRVGGRGRAERA